MCRSYGTLGCEIILRHFANLVSWGYLPTSKTTEPNPPYHPLSSGEFMIHVLVPEAAIRLIMEDEGWNGEQPAECHSWKVAWHEASGMRRASVEFGRHRHPVDGESSETILDAVEVKKRDIKMMIQRIRGSEEQDGSSNLREDSLY